MSIPFIDLKTQYARVAPQVEQGLRAVLESGAFINGPDVAKLEKRLAEYCGTRYAVGCASGTDALMMALMALKVGPGDAVFCPPFTFMATAEVVALLGATPVFVDIDPETFNIDPAFWPTTRQFWPWRPTTGFTWWKTPPRPLAPAWRWTA